MPQMDAATKGWRLELFFKSASELRERTLPLLREHGIQRVNLTNKTKDDRLLESAGVILKAVPGASVCLHYSLKWRYAGGVDPSFQRLQDFVQQAGGLPGAGHSVLLVSGGGKKKKLDTVEALRRLSKAGQKPAVPLHVAFNPYFPEEGEAKEERQRLRAKLATGLVSGIWLQTGSDCARLEQGLAFLQEAAEGTPVWGSVFLPSKKLLAQMRYRPWNGVFLSDEYLSSVEAATEITRQLLACYRKHGVTPLLETALRSTEDMRSAAELLGLD